jgi:hypothetical protein
MCGRTMHDASTSSRTKPAGSVAFYLRVSTEEQRERQSIDTQREFGAKYTDLHQLRIQSVYADDGISGTIPIEKRPEGKRILQGRVQSASDLRARPARPGHPSDS